MERHLDQDDHGERADGDEEGGGDRARPLVGQRALVDQAAQLEDQQPDDESGQEQDPAQHHDHGQPVVPGPADVVRRQGVLDDRLRFGAEGLDQRFAAGAEHAGDDGSGEGLTEVRTEDRRPLAARVDGRLVPFVVGLLDVGHRVVPVGRRGQREGRRLPLVAGSRHLWSEDVRVTAVNGHSRPRSPLLPLLRLSRLPCSAHLLIRSSAYRQPLTFVGGRPKAARRHRRSPDNGRTTGRRPPLGGSVRRSAGASVHGGRRRG